MKKPIAWFSVLLALSLLFTACGESSSPTVNYGDSAVNASTMPATTESVTEPENTIPLTITLDSEGYVPLNEDGIVELKSYSETSYELNPCTTTYSDYSNAYIVVWKHADEPIPKIKKDTTVGIYNTYDSIDIVPIGDTMPQYTVPLNFFDSGFGMGSDDGTVDDFPDELTATTKYFPDKNDLMSPGCPLTECNGQELVEYVNSHSSVFYYEMSYYSVGYKLLNAQKNEEFTFGGYVGTEWREITVPAYLEYYNVHKSNTSQEKITQTVATEKTKNGYFAVDFSGFEPGIYYVATYDTFIELV